MIMHYPKKLEPGQAVKIEHTARIVRQMDGNPYFYEVEYPDNRPNELVSIARIIPLADLPRVTIDEDGSMQVFSTRLSAAGAVELLTLLQTRQAELMAVTQADEVTADS